MSASSDGGGLLSRWVETEGLGGEFTEVPEISIDWGGMLKAIVGAVLLGVANGFIRLIQLPAQIITALFEALATFLADVIAVLFGVGGVFELAFVSARADVIASGIAGFAVAILVAGAALVIANQMVSLVVGE